MTKLNKSTLTEDEITKADFYSFLNKYWYLPNGNKYSFKNHDYLIDIAKESWNSRVVGKQVSVRKSSQCGISELMIAWVIWLSWRRLMGWQGVGYTFPAKKQLDAHLKSRLHPILAMPWFIEKVGANNLEYIRWNDSPIYFRSGHTRRNLISFPADAMIIDELDEYDNPVMVIETLKARFNHSLFKWVLCASTPTYPAMGIDEVWSHSTKKHWFVNCHLCKKEFSPLQEVEQNRFENCVVKAPISNQIGFLCPHCHELTQTNGVAGNWRVTEELNEKKVCYSVSRLFTHHATLEELYGIYEDALNVQEFYNSHLGLPYASGDVRLTSDIVCESANGDADVAPFDKGPNWMGCDIGKTCHYIIGRMDEFGKKRIIAYGQCVFDELAAIEVKYGVTCAVYDLRPYEVEIKRHVQGRSGFYACEFDTGGQDQLYKIDTIDKAVGTFKKMNLIKANRTQACDLVVKSFFDGGVSLPQSVKADRKFLSQITAPTRINRENPTTGDISCIYHSGGKADHYFFAAVYFELALMMRRSRIATFTKGLFC